MKAQRDGEFVLHQMLDSAPTNGFAIASQAHVHLCNAHNDITRAHPFAEGALSNVVDEHTIANGWMPKLDLLAIPGIRKGHIMLPVTGRPCKSFEFFRMVSKPDTEPLFGEGLELLTPFPLAKVTDLPHGHNNVQKFNTLILCIDTVFSTYQLQPGLSPHGESIRFRPPSFRPLHIILTALGPPCTSGSESSYPPFDDEFEKHGCRAFSICIVSSCASCDRSIPFTDLIHQF